MVFIERYGIRVKFKKRSQIWFAASLTDSFLQQSILQRLLGIEVIMKPSHCQGKLVKQGNEQLNMKYYEKLRMLWNYILWLGPKDSAFRGMSGQIQACVDGTFKQPILSQ